MPIHRFDLLVSWLYGTASGQLRRLLQVKDARVQYDAKSSGVRNQRFRPPVWVDIATFTSDVDRRLTLEEVDGLMLSLVLQESELFGPLFTAYKIWKEPKA